MADKKSHARTLYHLGDSLLCLFVFFPTMVIYWRGIWDLWGVYIYPGEIPKQKWILLLISSTSIFGYFLSPLLHHILDKNNKILYFITTRLYMYVYAALYMCFWRSLWELADYYLPINTIASLINIACTYIPLLLLRASRCCIFPPMYTNLDTRDNLLIPTTRFLTTPHTVKYFFDCLFSHFVLLGLTIVTWRGMWNFLGSIIHPDNPALSDKVCYALGNALVIIIFCLEESLATVTVAMEHKGFYYKLIWEDFVYTFIFVCHAVLWRGGWNLTATYIISDPELGGWVCCISGTIALTLLQLFSFVSAHGVAIDGLEVGAEAIFPTRYLRTYLADYNNNKPHELQSIEVNGNGKANAVSTNTKYSVITVI